MISQLPDFDRLLLVLFAVLLLNLSWKLYVPRLRRRWKHAKARLPRRWKSRSPKDCTHYCQGLRLESRPVQREVEPYAKRESTRGRKQEICFDSTIQTAFIERVNLTIRRGVTPLMRKTWALAQSP